MFGKLETNRGVLTLAIMLFVFAPGVAYAEKNVDNDEADHSNQDWGEPDTSKAPQPGNPAHWGGPKSGTGFGDLYGDLGLPSGDGAESWISDVLTGASPQLWPFPVQVTPAADGPLGGSLVRQSLGLGNPGPRPVTGGIGDGSFAPPPPVPEPATAVLLLLGAALLAARGRK